MSASTFYRRAFLNRRPHHGGAYVIADISSPDSASLGTEHVAIEASLTIADCGRASHLDFFLGCCNEDLSPNAAGHHNRLDSVDR